MAAASKKSGSASRPGVGGTASAQATAAIVPVGPLPVAPARTADQEDRTFAHAKASGISGLSARPAMITTSNRATLVDSQKFRNNWGRVPLRDKIAVCRKVAESNWLVRPVLTLRVATITAGLKVTVGKRDPLDPPETANTTADSDPDEESAGVDAADPFGGYDFASLVNDIAWEDGIASNVVALWRKGEEAPVITILDGERIDYRSSGGLERITLQCSQDRVMALDTANKEHYIKALGQRMYEACCSGRSLTIIRGLDEDWDFEAMCGMKRRGAFCEPELVSLLDDLDWIELMKVGDWNLAYRRKDVIRLIKKGYPITNGSNAGVASVNITPKEVDDFGKGFSGVSGISEIPLNHDVNVGYLNLDPGLFEPKQFECCHDRLLVWGNLEAVVLFGSFSQQNGASPSLMRNMRVRVLAQRAAYILFLRRIFEHEEFAGHWSVEALAIDFHFSLRPLYSVEELISLVTTTGDGLASPQTRRDWLDLDEERESELMRQAHRRRDDFVPPFEAKQGQGAGGETPPGRPAKTPEG